MHRRALTCLLSLFLLLMQHESLRHALDHAGAQLQRIEHSVLERATGDTCVECELLASGAASSPAAALPPRAADPVYVPISAPATPPAVAAFSFYRSRAPPPVLQHA